MTPRTSNFTFAMEPKSSWTHPRLTGCSGSSRRPWRSPAFRCRRRRRAAAGFRNCWELWWASWTGSTLRDRNQDRRWTMNLRLFKPEPTLGVAWTTQRKEKTHWIIKSRIEKCSVRFIKFCSWSVRWIRKYLQCLNVNETIGLTMTKSGTHFDRKTLTPLMVSP